MSLAHPTAERVPRHTRSAANEQIRDAMEQRIRYYAVRPDEIEHRLEELDEEWDIERVLETNASSLIVASTLLGAAHDRRWLLLTAGVGGFLLQHAVQGWCPPLPVFRNLGYRTEREIDHERYALKYLRGDFENVDRDLALLRGEAQQEAGKLRRAVAR